MGAEQNTSGEVIKVLDSKLKWTATSSAISTKPPSAKGTYYWQGLVGRITSWTISCIYDLWLEKWKFEEKRASGLQIVDSKQTFGQFFSTVLTFLVTVLCRFYRAEAMELIADHKSQPGGRKYWKIPILQNPMSFDHKLLHNFWEHQNQAKAFTAMQRVPMWKMSEMLLQPFSDRVFESIKIRPKIQCEKCQNFQKWKMLLQPFSDRAAACRLKIRQDFNLRSKTLWKDFSIASSRPTTTTVHSPTIPHLWG